MHSQHNFAQLQDGIMATLYILLPYHDVEFTTIHKG